MSEPIHKCEYKVIVLQMEWCNVCGAKLVARQRQCDEEISCEECHNCERANVVYKFVETQCPKTKQKVLSSALLYSDEVWKSNGNQINK